MIIWQLPLTNGEIDKVKTEIKETPLKKNILEILLDQLKKPNNNVESYSKLELIEIFGLRWICNFPTWYECDKVVLQYALQDMLKE